MSSIFISYSSKDSDFAHKLSNDLKSFGIDVWLDEWEIKVGDDIRKKVEHGITTYKYFGIILSKNAVASKWVDRELSAAYMKEIEDGNIFILPIMKELVKIPALISGKKYANFSQNYQNGFDNLKKLFYSMKVKGYKDFNFQSKSVATARRGPKGNVACVFTGQEHWSITAIIESIGDSEAAQLATSSAQSIFEVLFTNLKSIEPHEINGYIYKLINSALMYDRNKSGTENTNIAGTSIVLCVQVNDNYYLSNIGRCSAIGKYILNDDMDIALIKADSAIEGGFKIDIPRLFDSHRYKMTEHQHVPIIAPLGHISSDDFTVSIIKITLRKPKDYIVLTSFPLPHTEDELFEQKMSCLFTQENNPELIAKNIFETDETPLNGMSAVLMKER